MNKSPLVSIVIPIYMVEKYLENSIQSVLNQSYKHIEVILVNDGSPDNCPNICEVYADRDERVRVIHKSNGGLSDARNAGLAVITGQYLVFLDADDTLMETAVEDMLNRALETDSDMVIPNRYIQINEETMKSKMRLHFEDQLFSEDPTEFVVETMIGKARAWRAHALLYNASLIKEHKFTFPVGYIAEDVFFNMDFMAKARKIVLYDKPTLYYLKRSGSITTSFNDKSSVFLKLDSKIDNYLKDNYNDYEYGSLKRKELLCRNSIEFISDVWSKRCPWDQNKRLNKIEEFLDNNTVREAFSVGSINPYFDSRIKSRYFKTMFSLLKKNSNKMAYNLAKIQGKFR